MCETTGSLGFAPRCQSPNPTYPFTPQKKQTAYDIMQDVIAIKKAEKLAKRMEELNSKSENERTPLEKMELAYYNALKNIAKLQNIGSTVFH